MQWAKTNDFIFHRSKKICYVKTKTFSPLPLVFLLFLCVLVEGKPTTTMHTTTYCIWVCWCPACPMKAIWLCIIIYLWGKCISWQSSVPIISTALIFLWLNKWNTYYFVYFWASGFGHIFRYIHYWTKRHDCFCEEVMCAPHNPHIFFTSVKETYCTYCIYSIIYISRYSKKF